VDCGIIISKTWPTLDRGYGFAVNSSLHQYCNFFSQVFYIALTIDPIPHEVETSYNNVIWKQIQVKKEKKWVRFLKSISVACPTTVIQYAAFGIENRLYSVLSNYLSNFSNSVIIFEDIPTAYHLFSLKRKLSNTTFVLRSHNVLSEIFEGFDKDGIIFKRFVWLIEIEKSRKFERRVLDLLDKCWTISYRDSIEYLNRYNKRCEGTFGVCINTNRYRNIPQGDISTVIYIGSADLRKGSGLSKFIHTSWESIIKKRSGVKLVLAGRDTNKFDLSSLSVEGKGYVGDDIEILKEGMIFINPQEYGSGLKLKSIIAMLSGKVLVSTRKGLEGIEGKDGEHFFRAKKIGDMKDIILDIMNHKSEAIQVGRQARELATSIYNEKNLTLSVKPLFTDLSGLNLRN